MQVLSDNTESASARCHPCSDAAEGRAQAHFVLAPVPAAVFTRLRSEARQCQMLSKHPCVPSEGSD